MEGLVTLFIAIITAIAGSSGFWLIVQKRDDRRTARDRMIMGLAYDRIMYLGMRYVTRGWMTKDEYEDLVKYFYEPYKEFGGNGTAEKVMQEVKALPFAESFDVIVQMKKDIKEEHK